MIIVCDNCNKNFNRPPCRVAESKKHFCSVRCLSEYSDRPEVIEARFWKYVDKSGGPDACWLWTGARSEQNYGVFSIGTSVEDHRNMVASRYAYEIKYGPMKDGLFACHKCDNPPCCNPAHIFAGTADDNHKDMFAKKRNVVLRGDDAPNAKLTSEQVLSIRAEYAKGEVLQTQLAKRYGVTSVTIGQIVRRGMWKHI